MSKQDEFLRREVGPWKQYFFYFDKPYRKISQSIRRNQVEAYDILDEKRIMLPYNSWKRSHQKAYSTSEAARILNRTPDALYKWMRHGEIPKPFAVPHDPEYADRKVDSTGGFLWREQDFRNAVDYMQSTTYWRTAPSWDEVAANLNEDEVIRFVLDENGDFIPIWRAD